MLNYLTSGAFLLILLMIVIGGCSQERTEDPPPKLQDNTAEMAELLRKAHAAINPAAATYLVSDRRLAYFKSQVNDQDFNRRITAIYWYCVELVNSGNLEQGIVEIESVIGQLAGIPGSAKITDRLEKVLAIAYLRLGEVTNCIGNRTHASCIVPIGPEGRHTMTAGSEKAIEVLLRILEKHPGDEESIWLLNLAHMTLGTYPDGVPAKYRIDPSSFNSDYQIERFLDVSQKAGLSGTGLAGGCSIEDFNNDGFLDIIASSWGLSDPLKYYVNDGRGKFTDKGSAMGLEGITGGLNLVHADFDNDGHTDLFVCRGAWLFNDGAIPNSLLRNNGDGTFSDVTISAGLLAHAPTQSAVWTDINRDGWIDIFVGSESSPKGRFASALYLNNGNGTFRNVIDRLGMDLTGFVKGVTAGDINSDGWPDLYISYYGSANRLLLNRGTGPEGVPVLEDIAAQAGVREPLVSFPTWFWDFNNDGLDDIFVSSYGIDTLAVAREYVQNLRGSYRGAHPRLYINNGDLTFSDVSVSAGLRSDTYTMGSNYGDLDNDGFLDMYLGTGDPSLTSVVPNRMFRNERGVKLQDVTTSGGFGHIQKGHAIAFGDMDNDGDEDIFEVLGGAYEGDMYENILFRNPTDGARSWVVLRLEGTRSNRSAIGARVKVVTDTGATFWRRVSTGGSFGSSSLQVEVGLGDAEAIRTLEIAWPDAEGSTEVFSDLEVMQHYRIVQGSGQVQRLDSNSFALGGE